LPYWTTDQTGVSKITLTPVVDIPAVLVLMKLHPPTILEGKPPVANFFKGELWISFDHAEIAQLSKKPRARALEMGKFKVDPFVQMLAKIGHAFAVAEHGADSFTPFLLDVIFARTSTPTHWVGGTEYSPPAPKNTLHVLQADPAYRVNGRFYMVVYIRLFNHADAPTYCVVVGERPAPV
jgi:hypothetical protein